MSSEYMRYDHAGWVQEKITGVQARKATKRDQDRAAQHQGWHGAPKELNPFQARAFTILGLVGGGIYNCPIGWDSLRWWPRQIIVPWSGGMDTWDFNRLTELCFLCHVGRIRGGLSPCNKQWVHVMLHQREATGSIGQRHPNLEQAVGMFNSWYDYKNALTFPGDPPPPDVQGLRTALTAYHRALDTRQNGNTAAGACVDAFQDILGMPWIQGATLPPTPEPPKPDKVDT